jgi:hypothetical protein
MSPRNNFLAHSRPSVFISMAMSKCRLWNSHCRSGCLIVPRTTLRPGTGIAVKTSAKVKVKSRVSHKGCATALATMALIHSILVVPNQVEQELLPVVFIDSAGWSSTPPFK